MWYANSHGASPSTANPTRRRMPMLGLARARASPRTGNQRLVGLGFGLVFTEVRLRTTHREQEWWWCFPHGHDIPLPWYLSGVSSCCSNHLEWLTDLRLHSMSVKFHSFRGRLRLKGWRWRRDTCSRSLSASIGEPFKQRLHSNMQNFLSLCFKHLLRARMDFWGMISVLWGWTC